MSDKFLCVSCRKPVTSTKNHRFRTHTDGSGERCEASSTEIPLHVQAQPETGPADVPVKGVDYQVCPNCGRNVELTRLGYFGHHDKTLRGGDRCPVSGVRAVHAKKLDDVLLPGDEKASPIPEVPDSSTPAANRGITSPARTSTSAGADCSPTEHPLISGVTEPAMPTPAAAEPATVTEETSAPVANPKRSTVIDWSKVGDLKHLSTSEKWQPATEASFPASTTTSTILQPSTWSPGLPAGTSSDAPGSPVAPVSAASGPPALHLAPLLDDRVLQPFSHILQPTQYVREIAAPMGDLAKELVTRIKETFYAYSNRKTKDNRSAQTTLGPSEIGTPCDRRLAMALLGVPPVNAGGDGWAAFVGTCTHAGMAEIYTFADAGTGRYAVELPVFLGVPTVPRGTTDLLDRRDGTITDWKVMGKYSLDKFRKEGPSDTYRTQAHVYGLGAERGGEKVRNVAIVGLPRAGSSLDEMHVWTEPYDRKFAQAALARVERIANDIDAHRDHSQLTPEIPVDIMYLARQFPMADKSECRFCPHFLKGDKDMQRGCPGP